MKDIYSAKSSFHYVIKELLGYNLDEPTPLSLLEHFGNEIDMIKILSMYIEDIDHLTFHVSPSIVKDLHKTHKKSIKTLLGFSEFRYNEGKPIVEDWSIVTKAEFQNFQFFVYRKNPIIIPSNLILLASNLSVTSNGEKTSPLQKSHDNNSSYIDSPLRSKDGEHIHPPKYFDRFSYHQ